MSAPTMADEELMTDEELAALSDSQLGDIILGLCYSGSVDAIADLLKFRPSVTTYQTDGGICALHVACRGDDETTAEDIVEVLIMHGADVNAATYDLESNEAEQQPVFWTPLMEASYFGSTGIVQMLLNARADVTQHVLRVRCMIAVLDRRILEQRAQKVLVGLLAQRPAHAGLPPLALRRRRRPGRQFRPPPRRL